MVGADIHFCLVVGCADEYTTTPVLSMQVRLGSLAPFCQCSREFNGLNPPDSGEVGARNPLGPLADWSAGVHSPGAFRMHPCVIHCGIPQLSHGRGRQVHARECRHPYFGQVSRPPMGSGATTVLGVPAPPYIPKSPSAKFLQETEMSAGRGSGAPDPPTVPQ